MDVSKFVIKICAKLRGVPLEGSLRSLRALFGVFSSALSSPSGLFELFPELFLSTLRSLSALPVSSFWALSELFPSLYTGASKFVVKVGKVRMREDQSFSSRWAKYVHECVKVCDRSLYKVAWKY